MFHIETRTVTQKWYGNSKPAEKVENKEAVKKLAEQTERFLSKMNEFFAEIDKLITGG